MRLSSLILASLAVVTLPAPAAPELLSYQGRILVSNVNYDGQGYFKFALTNAPATQTFWTNDGTASGEPGNAVELTINKGLYSVLLGDSTLPNMTAPVTSSVFSGNDEVHLQVWFSTNPGGPFSLLSPAPRISSSAYALSADTASSITPGYVAGSGADLMVQGSTAGSLNVETVFSDSFHGTPNVDLPSGWTIDGTTSDGFTASAGFAAQTVDPGGQTGTYSSLTLISGRPAIAYRDNDGGKLLYIRALDDSGSKWPSAGIVQVDGALEDTGQFASLAEVDGRPAISYYDASSGDLRFIRADDSTGTRWPSEAITVDGATSNVGRDTSLAVVGGVPSIAYQSPNTGEILFTWAADASGTSWPAANRVAIEGSLAAYRQHPALIDLGGTPAIAFYNQSDGDLRFTRFTGSDRTNPADWTTIDIITSGNVGANPSLSIVDGRPAIACDDASGTITYIRANDIDGTSWGSPVSAGTGRGASLLDLDTAPSISCYDPTGGDLILALGDDTTGTTWSAGNRLTVDGTTTNVGTHASLAMVGGLPAIAYHDESNLDLKFASLPIANWSASLGTAEPILAAGVQNGGVTGQMLSPELGIWQSSGDDLIYPNGKVGIGRIAVQNTLEVEGQASKSTAGNWAANSDRRIKTDISPVTTALDTLDQLKPVTFRYTPEYLEQHPAINDVPYYNVIAQEFREVFPDAVKGSGEHLPDGSEILQVDTYPAMITTIAAVKELNGKLQEKDRELQQLKARIARLEKLLEP